MKGATKCIRAGEQRDEEREANRLRPSSPLQRHGKGYVTICRRWQRTVPTLIPSVCSFQFPVACDNPRSSIPWPIALVCLVDADTTYYGRSTITATNVDAMSWFACGTYFPIQHPSYHVRSCPVHIRGWQTQGIPPTPNAIPATPNTATHVTTHTLHYPSPAVQQDASPAARAFASACAFSPFRFHIPHRTIFPLTILPYETLPHQQPAPQVCACGLEGGGAQTGKTHRR